MLVRFWEALGSSVVATAVSMLLDATMVQMIIALIITNLVHAWVVHVMQWDID
jgi:hypothetical protein